MKQALTIFLILIIIGGGVLIVTRKSREQKAQKDLYLKTSDAAKINRTITIAGDDWLGYAVCRSPRFAQILAQDGIGVKFEMEFDFGQRVAGLAQGKYQFAAITLDSYLAHGGQHQWPGVILWTIDESNGGDAILAVPPLTKIDDLNTARGAYTKGSPSEFLLRSQITHFRLDQLRGNLPQFGTDSVEEAYNQLKRGKAQFAVLWEPFKTKALREIPNSRVIIDTTQVQGVIVDIFVASREVVANDPDLCAKLSKAYFTTLHEWLNSPAKAIEAALRDIETRDHGKTIEDAEEMLKGIHFASLPENQDAGGWMSGDAPRLAESIPQISRILDNQGTPVRLPNSDPNAILFRKTVQETKGVVKVDNVKPKLASFYKPLSTAEWAALEQKVKGTLLETPIIFRPGQTEIPEETQEELRETAPKLAHYPSYRIVVQAHSYGNSEEVDQALSEERSAEVKRFLMWECSIPDERIHALGKGSTQKLQRFPDESESAYARRNRYARILLVGE